MSSLRAAAHHAPRGHAPRQPIARPTASRPPPTPSRRSPLQVVRTEAFRELITRENSALIQQFLEEAATRLSLQE